MELLLCVPTISRRADTEDELGLLMKVFGTVTNVDAIAMNLVEEEVKLCGNRMRWAGETS